VPLLHGVEAGHEPLSSARGPGSRPVSPGDEAVQEVSGARRRRSQRGRCSTAAPSAVRRLPPAAAGVECSAGARSWRRRLGFSLYNHLWERRETKSKRTAHTLFSLIRSSNNKKSQLKLLTQDKLKLGSRNSRTSRDC
jgi:hypothetical protein